MIHKKNIVLKTYIDLEDLQKVINFKYKWHVTWSNKTQSFYVVATQYLGIIDGKPKSRNVYLHRFIMDVNEYIDVDHFNHDTLDNRKSNLIIKERDKNAVNRKGKNANNTSGYRNVSWNRFRNKWMVQMQIDGKNTLLGLFDDVHEAGKFAEEMRNKYYNKFKGAS